MPRGGKRSNTPGAGGRANRTDMVNPSAQAAQVTRPPRVRAPEGVPTRGLQATPTAARQDFGGPEPGAFGDFTRPTERPQEPLTAGLPMGAGPGPEVLPQAVSTAGDELRALFLRFPSPELRELIEELDEEQRGVR